MYPIYFQDWGKEKYQHRKDYIVFSYLVFHARDSALIAPVKVGGEIAGGKDRSLLSVVRDPKRLQSEEISAELGGSEIGELGDAVDGCGVQLLVSLGPAQVGLEHAEPIVVLLLSGIALAELGLEGRKVVLCVEEMILAFRYHLTDQLIIATVDLLNGRG